MYHLFLGLEPKGSFKTFPEALKVWVPEIMKLVRTQQENAFMHTNSIGCFTDRAGQPMFYQLDPIEASNFAVENGFVKNQKVVEPPPEMSDRNVETLFIAYSLKREHRAMEAALLGAHFKRTGKIDL